MNVKSLKIIKVIFINIFVFLFLLFLLNMYISNNLEQMNSFSTRLLGNDLSYKTTEIENKIGESLSEKNIVEYIEITEESFSAYCGEQRFLYEKDNNRKPILVFGCSYAYGHGLKKEESFPFLLSKLTDRTVYNYAECGYDLLVMSEDYLSDNAEVKEKTYFSDTVIYLYMYDHINRYFQIHNLYKYYDDLFGISTNKVHNFLLHKVALYKYIFASLQYKKIKDGLPNTELMEQFLKKVILSSYKRIKEYTPFSKFIIILYEEKIPDNHDPAEICYLYTFIDSKIWDELEKETNGNIKIVRTKDMMGFYFDKDYKLKYEIADWHPNARVWKEFTPKFVEKYMK